MNKYEQLSLERKELQDRGLLPKWITTAAWQLFKEKYMWADSYLNQIHAIANTLARHTDNPSKWASRFFDGMWLGWISPSTPILANCGTNRGLVVSCSGGYIEDSIDGFYTSLHEMAMLTKHGFGTSAYLGDIRPRGSDISIGGKASGILPVLKMFVQTSRDVTQGTQRRGAWAGYIPIDHGDFDEIVRFLEKEPDDLNIGWNISDHFLSRLDSGDEDAKRRFALALKVKMLTGKGYFCFVDKCNRQLPEYYKKKGMSFRGSNLCVSGDTKIFTEQYGYKDIKELVGESVNVWNGKEWSQVVPRKTSDPVPLLTVYTNSTQPIKCTPEHIFYIVKDYGKEAIAVPANQLRPGDKLIKFDLPVIEYPVTSYMPRDVAYANGFFSGDGCHYKNDKMIYLYGEKKKLLPKLIKLASSVKVQESQDRIVLHHCDVLNKFWVPDITTSVQTRLDWLAGLLDSDGTVVTNGTNQSLQIGSSNKDFIYNVQLMLQTLGVNAKVTKSTKEGYYSLPANDGTGRSAFYHCQQAYRLLISSSGLYTLGCLGLTTERLEWSLREPQRNAEQFIFIEAVVDEGIVEETFCFTEPKRHMGMFNGILTGQCNEIILPSDKDHSFTCVLASLNLAKWDEWKDTDIVETITVFLDCVCSEFLEKAKDIPGMEKVVRFTEKARAIGIGALGFHTYLQEHRIPLESLEAHLWNIEVFSKIYNEAKQTTKWMADKWGACEWGDDVRNCSLVAIAPNKSTSVLMGGVSEGISPDPAMVYTQSTAGGEVSRINPALLSLMKDKNVYNDKNVLEVIDAFGSVQNVNWLTDDEKKVFKTAFEINQEWLIHLAGMRAKYVDQWQSLNLFFSSKEKPQRIAEVHKKAFMDERIKGVYYVYSNAGVPASKDVCEACVN